MSRNSRCVLTPSVFPVNKIQRLTLQHVTPITTDIQVYVRLFVGLLRPTIEWRVLHNVRFHLRSAHTTDITVVCICECPQSSFLPPGHHCFPQERTPSPDRSTLSPETHSLPETHPFGRSYSRLQSGGRSEFRGKSTIWGKSEFQGKSRSFWKKRVTTWEKVSSRDIDIYGPRYGDQNSTDQNMNSTAHSDPVLVICNSQWNSANAGLDIMT